MGLLQRFIKSVFLLHCDNASSTSVTFVFVSDRPTTMVGMSPYFNQLIILGNGFDLECGLNSQFKDYFATRESKPWLNCHNGSPWRGSENPKDPENVWDHIFQYEKANSPKTWTDVESIISKWVTKTESDQFNEAMASVNNNLAY